jgi:branched-chain amino acid transport system ATP-binding protein
MSTCIPAPITVEPAPILESQGVSVRFGGVAALNGVSIGAIPGEVLGFIGPNGAGKTTLFDVLSGVRSPTAGIVFYDGHDVTRRSATWRARHGIRRTFQRQQMFGWLTVEENVMVALEWRGGGGGLLADLFALPSRSRTERARRADVENVMEQCGLLSLKNEPAGKLPIGRARMVELARAIADSPKVLLLDEPTSGLEESDAQSLGELMIDIAHEKQCAVIIVEHDVDFVMRFSDRVIALNLGEVLSSGSPSDVRSDPRVQEAYLG